MMSKHSKMEVQDLPLDRLNNLPPNILQNVLTHMPMRDAFRTSVLSQNWRDHCLNIPKLVFDDAVFQGSAYETEPIKCKLLHVVYPILLRHQGPILEFSLCISQLISCCEIDLIILHLLRNATLKRFTLSIGSGDAHKLLPAFFKLQQLIVLKLRNCVFQPPVTFNGFSRLVCLSFNNVTITADVFLRFISYCPLVKDFTLIGNEKHLVGSWNSDFVALFKCLPLVVKLTMNWYPIKCFATGGVPQTLPFALRHLKYLHLRGLSFAREIDLLSAFLLVISPPKIETIIMEMQEHNSMQALSQTMYVAHHQGEHNSYNPLACLRVLFITNFPNMKVGKDFVKLILAKSPMLKKVHIRIDKGVDRDGEVKLLKELIQYPRASPSAEIIIT